MRMAALMALIAAGGKLPLPIDAQDLLRRTPLGAEGGPLDKLTGDLRGQLIDAGRSVAMAAASNRIDSLSDKLQQRAERMRTADVKRQRRPAEEETEARGRPAPEEYGGEYEEGEEDYIEEYEPEERVTREEESRRAAPLPRQEPRRRAPSTTGAEAPPRARARR